MAERNIKILVRDKKALVEGGPVIVCGNSDYTITFDFDNDWNPGGVRTARFVYMRGGQVLHQDVVFEGTTVSVPVLSGITSVKVGVFEGDLSTTTPARISCEGSILCGTGTPEEPTQDVYDQIMALFDSLAGQGSFGATEAQARQIEANKANIEKLETGETKAGDTEKLGGQTAEEWQEVIAAKVESEDALEFGGASGPEFTDTPETIMAALREMDEELDAMREELDALGEAGGGTGGGASTAENVTYENESVADVTNVKEALDNVYDEITNIKSFVGYFENGIVGVEVDFVNKTFTRLADAVSMTAGADFSTLRAFGGRRRCNVANDGTVNAYYGDIGYTETGSNGQVMIEQPKFYYKVIPLELEAIEGGNGSHMRKGQYYISDTLIDGFKVHPAFVRNGVEKDYIYLSAYEGSTYDVSASSYNLTDAQTVDWENDLLSSIANAKPTSGVSQTGATRAGFRAIAAKRGNGWTQATIQSVSATQLLFLVEYASFDMQEKIGIGVSNKNGDDGTNMAENTGATTNLGNETGSVTNANGFNVVTYRGEENFFCNIWKWVDGINTYNYGVGSVYISDNSFADNIGSDAYKDAGITICGSNGYISAFGYNGDFDWLFIPSECNGDSSLPVGDNFRQVKADDLWTVAKFSGNWNGTISGGGFRLNLDDASSVRINMVGSRLLYVPQ